MNNCAFFSLVFLNLIYPFGNLNRVILIAHADTEDVQFKYTLDDGYPIGQKFGGIAGIDVDKDGNLIIFDRGSHRWDESTFNSNDVYMLDRRSPIVEDTVITIDPKTKEKTIVKKWGRNKFFMPHGLSLDQSGNNIWLTDVALHQVFKYTIDGEELLSLGVPFEPGNDDKHFCKPTSVADTGGFIFVADGYCNSRIVMFSSDGSYLGEFGQSIDASYGPKNSNQPVFAIPHKIIYANDTKMIYVADRENGQIQSFKFEPDMSVESGNKHLMLKGAIKPEFKITNKAFNGRVFSVDYNPIRGGILVAVSGLPLTGPSTNVPVGLVFNATTGDLISQFEPPKGKTFGMAHDLAITANEASSVFVVDIVPVNLWKFSRPVEKHLSSRAIEITRFAGDGITKAVTIIRENHHGLGFFWAILLLSILATIVFVLIRIARINRHSGRNPFGSLSSNGYPTSVNSLFGNSNKFHRRSDSLFSGMFSRGNFFNMINMNKRSPNEFSRVPLDESDNSDEDKSDSDVEEFNISQANPSVKINV